MAVYGQELILDLHNCNVDKFTRKDLKEYFKGICTLLGLKRSRLYFWDYEGDEKAKAEAPPHLAGTTAVQFIQTSDIRIHTLDKLAVVFVNIFSCGEFDVDAATDYTRRFFDSAVTESKLVTRG